MDKSPYHLGHTYLSYCYDSLGQTMVIECGRSCARAALQSGNSSKLIGEIPIAQRVDVNCGLMRKHTGGDNPRFGQWPHVVYTFHTFRYRAENLDLRHVVIYGLHVGVVVVYSPVI